MTHPAPELLLRAAELLERDRAIVRKIFTKYQSEYGRNLQGCCLLIADEIKREIGGDAVAGELTWFGGSCRRTHWWIEKEGVVIDPMGDEFLNGEVAPGRHEEHRDQEVFASLLPEYERWRV